VLIVVSEYVKEQNAFCSLRAYHIYVVTLFYVHEEI
jgi:hypothetical protein